MPTLPSLDDTGQLVTPNQRVGVNANASAFGGQTAEAVAGLGSALGNVADAAHSIDLQLDEASTKELDTTLSARIRDRLTNAETGYLTTAKGRNAWEQRQPIEKLMRQDLKDLMPKARSDRARYAFEQAANERMAAALQSVNTHAAGQWTDYQNGVSGARMSDAAENIVAGWGDNRQIDLNASVIRAEQQAIGERNGQSQEEIATRTRDALSGVYYDGYLRQLDTDPGSVLKILRERKGYSEHLDEPKRQTLINAAQAQLDRNENKWKSSVLKQFSGERAAYMAGVKVTKPGDIASYRAALGDEAADEMEGLRTVAEQSEGMALMPLEQLVAIVNAPPPTLTDAAGVKAKRLDSLTKDKARNILDLRRDDPVAYLQQNNLLDAEGMAPAVDPTGAAFYQTLRSRASAMAQNYAWRGEEGKRLYGNLNPLTKQEEKAVIDIYAKGNPQDRANILGAAAKTLPPAVYKAFVAQIASASSNTQRAGYLMGLNPGYAAGGFVPQGGRPDGKTTFSAQMVADRLLRGEQLLNPSAAAKDAGIDKAKIPEPSYFEELFATTVSNGNRSGAGGAFDYDETEKRQMIDATRALYAALYEEQGGERKSGASDQPDPAIAKKALELATGGVAMINNKATPMPYGWDQMAFQTYMKSNWASIAKASGLTGRFEDYQFARARGVGPGTYQITQKGGNGLVGKRKDGTPTTVFTTIPGY